MYTDLDVGILNPTYFSFENIMLKGCGNCLYIDLKYIDKPVKISRLVVEDSKKNGVVIATVKDLTIYNSVFYNNCQ